MAKSLMKDTSHPRYEKYAERVRQFEAVYGEDWDGTMVEYDNDFVNLPLYTYSRLHSRAISVLSSNGSAKATSRKGSTRGSKIQGTPAFCL